MQEKKTIAILQSCYIPWKGYFDIVGLVDEFILYDETQYTRRDWRNRNRIKTAAGLTWLTIPVNVKSKYHQLIAETEIQDSRWAASHFRSIEVNYRRAAHFQDYAGLIEDLYAKAANEKRLSKVNELFLRALCELLDIPTQITQSSDYGSEGQKTDRLISICLRAGATDYLSGPSAKDYLEPEKFAAHGIKLHFMDYSGYPAYRQLFGAFEHEVSIVDLLFNEGPRALEFMKTHLIKPT